MHKSKNTHALADEYIKGYSMESPRPTKGTSMTACNHRHGSSLNSLFLWRLSTGALSLLSLLRVAAACTAAAAGRCALPSRLHGSGSGALSTT